MYWKAPVPEPDLILQQKEFSLHSQITLTFFSTNLHLRNTGVRAYKGQAANVKEMMWLLSSSVI